MEVFGRGVGLVLACGLGLAPDVAAAAEGPQRPWFFQGGPRMLFGAQWLDEEPILAADFGGKVVFGRHFGGGMTGPGLAVEAQSGVDTWLGVGLHYRYDVPLRTDQRSGFYVAPVFGAAVGVGGLDYFSIGMACSIVDSLFGVRDSACMEGISPWHARVFAGPEFVWTRDRFRLSLRTPIEGKLGSISTEILAGGEVGFGMSF